jgi:hypothetical protein
LDSDFEQKETKETKFSKRERRNLGRNSGVACDWLQPWQGRRGAMSPPLTIGVLMFQSPSFPSFPSVHSPFHPFFPVELTAVVGYPFPL